MQDGGPDDPDRACLTPKDMLDIQGLIAEFCLRNDRPEFGVVADLFTPDATLRLGALTLQGRDAIASFFVERNARHAAMSRVTRHVCGAIAIRPLGPDMAEIHTGLLVFAGVGDLPLMSEAPSTIGDFDAVCVRDPDGVWRFASRTAIPIFLSPQASGYLRSPREEEIPGNPRPRGQPVPPPMGPPDVLDYPLSRMFYDLHRQPALADAYRADRDSIISRYGIAEPVAAALRRDDVAFLARRTNPFLLRYYFFVTGMSEGDFIAGLQANRVLANG